MNKVGNFKGYVLKYSNQKKFGFIRLMRNKRHVTNASDIFVHETEIKDKVSMLFEDEMVDFDLYSREDVSGKSVFLAKNVKKIRSGSSLETLFGRGVDF